MTEAHQPEATLRALKLSGMLDTLQARLAQASAGGLGEFGALSLAESMTHARCGVGSRSRPAVPT